MLLMISLDAPLALMEPTSKRAQPASKRKPMIGRSPTWSCVVMLPALRLHAMCSHETRARRSALLPFGGSDRPMLPPSIRFDTAIGEGLTPAGASRDQRLALVR